MRFNSKGQGALEYLLLIGGAVLVAVIVIVLLTGMATTGKSSAQAGAEKYSEAALQLKGQACDVGDEVFCPIATVDDCVTDCSTCTGLLTVDPTNHYCKVTPVPA